MEYESTVLPTELYLIKLAVAKGLEPSLPAVTGQYLTPVRRRHRILFGAGWRFPSNFLGLRLTLHRKVFYNPHLFGALGKIRTRIRSFVGTVPSCRRGQWYSVLKGELQPSITLRNPTATRSVYSTIHTVSEFTAFIIEKFRTFSDLAEGEGLEPSIAGVKFLCLCPIWPPPNNLGGLPIPAFKS